MNRLRLRVGFIAVVASSGCMSQVGSSDGQGGLRDTAADDDALDAGKVQTDAQTHADAATSHDAGAATDARADEPRDEPVESYKAIYADILAPKCATPYCHVATNRGGLNMTSASEAYNRLVNKKAGDQERDPYSLCKESGLTRVVPFDPDASLLVEKLAPSSGTVVCGKAMPLDKPALSSDEIARISRWIKQGATNN